MLLDNEAVRVGGEEEKVTPRVRASEREAHAFAMNKASAGPDGMGRRTRSQLLLNRRCERREYDNAHFGTFDKEYPRYSDQSVPWFHLARTQQV